MGSVHDSASHVIIVIPNVYQCRIVLCPTNLAPLRDRMSFHIHMDRAVS